MGATGDQEGENSDDLTGKKKPKLQMLKSRLFGKVKRKGNEGVMKQSQSASDIMEGILNLEDDFSCSQSMLGSRALSHDSIFLADQSQSDPEPPRVLSQENIHGKIRALQMKLQQQNMHLGPPPLVLPVKRSEDPGGSSEDDGLPHSPPEVSGLPKNMPYKSSLQPSSQPISPRPISPTQAPASPSAPVLGVDFSTPPQFVPCLDNSAARHRMSIKPRNQRASTKNRRLPNSAGHRPRSESMNNLERPLTESEEEEGAAVAKEMTRVRSYSSQIIRPGQALSALQPKSPLSALPLKSVVGAGDGYPLPAMSEPKRSISPTSTSLQHSVKKQQIPMREAAPSQTPEVPSSALPTSKKWSGDLREGPLSPRLRSAQESTVSAVSIGAEQNQPQSEKGSTTISTNDKINRKEVKEIVHEDHPRGQPFVFPQATSGGVALWPPSLRRNTSPLDEKVVAKNLQQISTALPPGLEDKIQRGSSDQQRIGSFRFPVSSDKTQERQRTSSFTGVATSAGATREVAPLALSSINLKPQDQLKSVQVRAAGTEPLLVEELQKTESSASNTTVQSKAGDQTSTCATGQAEENSQASDAQETGVEAEEEEVQEGVEEADEAIEILKESQGNEEVKEEEEKNAFGVKLRSTSISQKFHADKAKSELRDGVSTLPVESTAPADEGQKDRSAGPVRGTMTAAVSKKSPIHTAEAVVSVQVSSSPPQSARDKDRPASMKLYDVGTPAHPSFPLLKGTKLVHSLPKDSTSVSSALKESAPVSLITKEITPVCTVENIPTITAAKQTQETTSEVSWMSMAREKTRSLQQLFTSKLPDFTSLQTTTRSTNVAPPQTKTSTSQPDVGHARPIQQIPAAQPSIRPLQTVSSEPPITQASARSTYSAQSTSMQSSMRSAEETTGQSGVADFSLKQTLSTTCQAQTTQVNARTAQLPAASSTAIHYTAKPVQSMAVHSTIQHLSQPPTQAQSQTLQATTQSSLHSAQSTCFQLSSSSKLTSQEPVSIFSQPRPQMGEDVLSAPLGRANRTSVHQEKGPEEGRTQWTGGLGSKTLLTERWENRTADAAKVEDQISKPESRLPPQSMAAYRPMSSPSKFTESAASFGSRRLDREDKWQKKTVPSSSSPSSSSPLQSVSDSGQPSWMELAKRKSLAWSDKTMD